MEKDLRKRKKEKKNLQIQIIQLELAKNENLSAVEKNATYSTS